MNEELTIDKAQILKRFFLHSVITLLLVAGIGWFSNEIILSKEWGGQYFLFTGILCVSMLLCAFLERTALYASLRNMGVLTVCFLLSGLLLLLSDYYVNLPVWVLGGIIAAALVSRNIGMMYLYFFVFHAIYLQGTIINGLVFHLVVATLICLIIPKMKNFLSMFYVMAFTSCVIVTGSVFANHFWLSGNMILDTVYILCTYLACIFITMLLRKWIGTKEEPAPAPGIEAAPVLDYGFLEQLAIDAEKKDAELEVAAAVVKEELFSKGKTSEEEQEAEKTPELKEEKKAAETVPEPEEEKDAVETSSEPEEEKQAAETAPEPEEKEEAVETVQEPEIDYTPYCDEKSELLTELRNKNKPAYAQSILTGKLAAEAAAFMGLNVGLTKAAGLYKRIGKIMDDATAETTTEIATVYEFPQELIDLLDQLNHEQVLRKEAAVLLLTDDVITYYSVMRRSGKDLPVEKIVDMVVSKKIFQGIMNDSGLGMSECAALRERLVSLLHEQDRRRNLRSTERK